ncbi:hypothetical protein MMC11_001450 [Xylographa trunciseda]|nr:hypothetical protein [Xylographa trunciseda]
MSPALAYTCYFWSIGNCKFHKDDCLYAHTYDALQPEAPTHFGYDQPALAGRNAAIAQAAANAGFDTSNTSALTSLISSVKSANRTYKVEEAYSREAPYKDRDDDTCVISRTPRGGSITRICPDQSSSSAVQPNPAVRARNVSPEMVSDWTTKIEAHGTGVERAFDRIMNMEACETVVEKASNPLTYVRASNPSVERARGLYEENSCGSNILGVGDIDTNFGSHHSSIERASDYPVTDTAHEFSFDIPSDLPLRALLREQEDRKQQPSSSFPHTLSTENQGISTMVTQPAPSGANNEPLGLAMRKRGATESGDASRPSKFRRTEDGALAKSTAVHDGLVIDLTVPERYVPPHRRQPILSNITNTQNTGYTVTTRTNSKGGTTTNLTFNPPNNHESETKAQRRRRRAAAVAAEQKVSQAEAASKKIFTRVFQRLSEFRTHLIQDREALSTRWEVDAKMQEPGVMNRMQELGNYMRKIDDALAGAIGVVRRIK